MKTIEYSNLTINSLFTHFFNSHNSLLITDNNNIIGAITYKSFINSETISNMLRNVIIIDNENEMEVGDLVNVYCIKEEDSYREVSKKIDHRYDFTIERFKDLYDDNDIITNYIKSLNTDTIYIIGDHKNYLLNFLNMYGLDINIYCIDDELVPYIFTKENNNSVVIDTTGFNTDLFNKVNERNNLNLKIFNLQTLSRYAEIYNFVNNSSKDEKVKSIVFKFPDISELTNLTKEEKERIIFDHYYKYYFEGYLKEDKYKELLESVFKEYFTKEFIESRYHMPKVYNKGGVLFLEDSTNPYCHSINGKRITTDQIKDYPANINMFGPCMVFSAMSDDNNTLPSYLQRLINNNYDYRVNNYGARAIDFSENLRTSRNITLHNNDINIFVIFDEDEKVLKEMGYSNIHSLTPVFNNRNLTNYFVDEPAHCNHEACKYMADYIYKIIEKELKETLTKEECSIISIPNKKQIFKNNRHLKDYLKSLEQYTDYDGETGAIVMNCNPFTNGHLNLIKYAKEQVDRLIVFVVEEDKSYFNFKDRFEMVKEGCKDFDNVIVVPSGNLLASALLFPEYFDKEDNPDVLVDASKDIEVFSEYIAPFLGITKRIVGEENRDKVTHAYNISLKEILPIYGIEVIEIPRFVDKDGNEISAKVVRRNYENDDWNELESQIPDSTKKVLKLIKDRRN